jgi:hypothetical protein
MALCLLLTNEIRNGCYFKVLFFDRIFRIKGILFACGEIPLGEGPTIQMILLILSKIISIPKQNPII